MPERNGPCTVVELPAVLDLNNVSVLKSMLMEKGDAGTPTMLDCSSVDRITTPAVQVLLAYIKTKDAEGCRLAFQNPSQAFQEAFRELGLEHQLSEGT